MGPGRKLPVGNPRNLNFPGLTVRAVQIGAPPWRSMRSLGGWKNKKSHRFAPIGTRLALYYSNFLRSTTWCSKSPDLVREVPHPDTCGQYRPVLPTRICMRHFPALRSSLVQMEKHRIPGWKSEFLREFLPLLGISEFQYQEGKPPPHLRGGNRPEGAAGGRGHPEPGREMAGSLTCDEGKSDLAISRPGSG